MSQGNVKRFVFKELKAGDLKKFEAASSTSGTGGGARDQRFSPYKKFDQVFAKMFPVREPVKRKMRDGTIRNSTLYAAPVAVHLHESGVDTTDPRVVNGQSFFMETVKFWPPTAKRTTEGRLGQVNKLKLVAPTKEGRVFLLIFEDGTPLSPRVTFVTENSVKNGAWEKSINKFFEDIFAEPETDEAVMGFKDIVAGTSYVKKP